MYISSDSVSLSAQSSRSVRSRHLRFWGDKEDWGAEDWFSKQTLRWRESDGLRSADHQVCEGR